MYLNKKNKILFLLINLCLIGFLLLNDPRSYIISEPHDLIIQAITIAISKLKYGLENYLGFKDIYLYLKNTPHISNFSSGYKPLLEGSLLNFGSTAEIINYNETINNSILNSLKLENINREKVFVYQNDLGYPIYVTVAFYLFGYDLKSITILFYLILFISSLIYLLNFINDNLSYLILFFITLFFIPILLINFGGDLQTIGSINPRFQSILVLIPVIFLSLMILRKNSWNKFNIVSIIFNLILISFIIKIRGTAYWGIIFLAIFLLINLFLELKYKKIKNKFKIFLILFIFCNLIILPKINEYLINKEINKNLNYNNLISHHMVWHNLFIGMSNFPIIYKNFVCFDNEEIIVKYDYKFNLQKCDNKYFLKQNNIKDLILLRNDDQHGLSAVVKYLNDNQINLKLGLKNSNAIEWDLDWNLYENILKKLYFNILKYNFLDVVYINFIIKPTEIVYNVIKSGYYLFNSFKHNTLINFIILLTTFLNFLIFLKFIKKKTFPFSIIEKKSLIIIYFSLIISLLSFPILFYPFIGTVYFELLITLFISSTICIINIFSK